MSELIAGRTRLNPASVARLPQGATAATAEAMAKNGCDDVVVRVGSDTFVASGRGIAGGLKVGASVTLDGKAGQVVQVDRQLDGFLDGMKAWPGLVVGGAGVAWGAVGAIQGLMTGSAFWGLGLFIIAGALVAGAAVNLVPAIFGASRKVDAGAVGNAAGR